LYLEEIFLRINFFLKWIGGALLLAMPAAAPLFYRFIQENLEKRGNPTGVAILEYSTHLF